MASKRKVRRRVAKALRKYVRGNPTVKVKLGGSLEAGAKRAQAMANRTGKPVEIHYRRVSTEGSSYGRSPHERGGSYWAYYDTVYPKAGNPPRVKGRKVKGGRSVTLRNFTGTIVRKSDGRVEILGRGRRK